MVKRFLLIILAWLPLLFLYGVIFYLSDQSSLPGLGGEVADFAWFKTAHVIIYATLGLFGLIAVSRTLSVRSRPKHKLLILYATLFLTVTLAALDEWHQSTTPGRDATVRDLVIDSLAIGAMLTWLARYNFSAASFRSFREWRSLRDVAQMARACAWGA